MTQEEYLREVRRFRNFELNRIDMTCCNAERWSAMTKEEQSQWAEYKQRLRDLPQDCLKPGFIHPEPPK